MREIAIRKVVGASGSHIFNLVMKGYFWIFLLAAGLGCYAGYALSKLLMDMIFRINSGVSMNSLIVFIYLCADYYAGYYWITCMVCVANESYGCAEGELNLGCRLRIHRKNL